MTHYRTLGVESTASTEAIKAAFRQLSLEHHPDRCITNKSEATVRFQQLSAAATVLTCPHQRAAYDKQLSSTSLFGAEASTAAKSAKCSHFRANDTLLYKLYRPRNLFGLPILFVTAIYTLQYFLTDDDEAVETVPAWFNPRTKAWETPAPWDPLYQGTQLQQKPRDQVRVRTR